MIESTIQEIFQKNLKAKKPGGITFIEGNDKTEYLSYKKLYLEATYMLHDLQEKGLKPGDELVFQFQSSKKFLITFWACVFGKIIPVPVTFGVSIEVVNKISSVWRKLKNPYLITDLPSLKDIIAGFDLEANKDIQKEIIDKLIQFEKPTYSKQASPLPASSSDLVFIQFSSGSTGSPKGVMNKQDNILYNLQNSIKHLNIQSSDKFLGWMPLTHDMGLVFFHLLPLAINAQQYLIPPIVFLTYPELWVKSLANHQITVSGSPNFGYKYALDNLEKIQLEELSFNQLRMMINSAEPVSIDVSRSFTKALSPYGFSKDVIKPGYGLAEAVLGVSLCYGYEGDLLREHFIDRNKLHVGNEVEFLDSNSGNTASFADLGPYYGTEIKITDESQTPLPDDTLGFVHLRSQAVTSGYYNDPDATQLALSEDRWFNTGDLGVLHNGHLVITGRAKEMILINGQNYFPNDLDKVIEELPNIKFQQAASCNVFNEEKHQDEIFVFILHDGSMQDFVNVTNIIKRHIRQRVGLGIKKIIKVNKIPKTTSGKVQRYVLRDNYFDGAYDDFLIQFETESKKLKSQIKKLSREEIEKQILATVEDLFTIDNLTNTSNFFDLGVTSLQIMQLKGSLESFIDEDLDEVTFFKHTTAKDLSEYIYVELLHNTTADIKQEVTDLSSAKARMKLLMKKA
ncbi:non-ribosomal peptide synthetase [Aquimarina sediminis]|uniref:non-ribosomal peptide synthetase n=1 Tax=Aquimarina sediminis TaxID=2070536 RepID=UPI000CA08040|nr:non-ribosomal peptide synthetase [Aquimarina sediminis]